MNANMCYLQKLQHTLATGNEKEKNTMNLLSLISIFLIFTSCKETSKLKETQIENPKITETSLIILGTVQDAGSPHIACTKDCCRDLFLNPDKNRKVVLFMSDKV